MGTLSALGVFPLLDEIGWCLPYGSKSLIYGAMSKQATDFAMNHVRLRLLRKSAKSRARSSGRVSLVSSLIISACLACETLP